MYIENVTEEVNGGIYYIYKKSKIEKLLENRTPIVLLNLVESFPAIYSFLRWVIILFCHCIFFTVFILSQTFSNNKNGCSLVDFESGLTRTIKVKF